MAAADALVQAGIARLLAARWGIAASAPRVQVATRLLWRVLLWAEGQPTGRNCALTVAVSRDGQITTYGGVAQE